MPELILQSLPYARDSSHFLRMLAAQPYVVFLDSGLASQPSARYDIISALPSAHEHVMRGHGNAFLLAQQLLARFSRPDADYQALAHLPFCGGLLGCFSYDAADSDKTLSPDTALASAQQLAGLPVAVLGLYEWAIVVDHQRAETTLFVLPQCPDNIRNTVTRLLTVSAMIEQSEKPPVVSFALQQRFSALMDKAAYADAFGRLQHYILAGDCYQSNLAIPFTANFSGAIEDAYLQLRERSRSPFSAFINAGEFAVLSLSPERFISVTDGRVFTQPIKGTRKRVAEPQQDQANIADLLSSEKDRAENLMIVDLLRNDLGRVCVTGSVKTEALFELHSFSHVHHLISSISAQLPADTSALQLLAQCFPGGSITGAPKIRAMQIIAELESVPRAVYCGSVFYHDFLNRMDSNICIRTLLAAGTQLYCWGGSGVVADSDLDQEFQECLDKVSVLMDLPLIAH